MREHSKTSVASLPICASLTGLRELFGWSGFSGGTDMFLINDLFGTVDGLGSLLHHAPTRLVPQHRRGKEQGINSVKHASVTRQKRACMFCASAALDKRF